MLSRKSWFALILLVAGFSYYLFLNVSTELTTKYKNQLHKANAFYYSKPKYNFSSYMDHPPNGNPNFQRVAELEDYAYVLSAFFNDKS